MAEWPRRVAKASSPRHGNRTSLFWSRGGSLGADASGQTEGPAEVAEVRRHAVLAALMGVTSLSAQAGGADAAWSEVGTGLSALPRCPEAGCRFLSATSRWRSVPTGSSRTPSRRPFRARTPAGPVTLIYTSPSPNDRKSQLAQESDPTRPCSSGIPPPSEETRF